LLMAYGTYSHSLKGNIDLTLAVMLLVCVTFGTQISLPLVRKYSGSKVRQAFAFMAYLVVLLLVLKLGSLVGFIKLPTF